MKSLTVFLDTIYHDRWLSSCLEDFLGKGGKILETGKEQFDTSLRILDIGISNRTSQNASPSPIPNPFHPFPAFTCKLFWNWNSTSGRAVGRYRQRDVERIGGRAHQPRDWHGPNLTQDQLRCELNLGDTFALFISSMKDMKKIFNLLIWFIDAIDDEVGRSWG